jgi:hypothetical protein
MDTLYAWQKVYREAILEVDDTLLREKIAAAQAVISVRLQELSRDHNGSGDERMAIADALNGLRVLREERQRRSA